MQKSSIAPVTNRGALTAQKQQKTLINTGQNENPILPFQNHIKSSISNIKSTYQNDIIIDWFEFTIKDKSLDEVLLDFGIIKSDLIHVQSGLFGYDNTFIYKEKMKFMISSRDYNLQTYIDDYKRWKKEIESVKFFHRDGHSKSDVINRYKKSIEKLEESKLKSMGIHIMFSGYACREFETEYDWYWLFDYANKNASAISRIDIAIDVFNDKTMTLPRIRKYLKRGLIVSKAKKALNLEERLTVSGEITGESVRIGSSASETMVVFYNKLQERTSANYIVSDDIKHWYRCEIRLRRESAKNFLNKAVNEYKDFGELTISVLNNLISIKDYKHNQSNNTDRYRWKNAKWWNEFVQTNKKQPLSSKAIQTSIQRKASWIEKSVEKTLASVFIANTDHFMEHDLQDYIINGIKKFDKMTLEQINSYRVEKGASILTQNDIDLIKVKLSEYKKER